MSGYFTIYVRLLYNICQGTLQYMLDCFTIYVRVLYNICKKTKGCALYVPILQRSLFYPVNLFPRQLLFVLSFFHHLLLLFLHGFQTGCKTGFLHLLRVFLVGFQLGKKRFLIGSLAHDERCYHTD